MSEISKEIVCDRNISSVKVFDESEQCKRRQREKRSHVSSGGSIEEDGFTTVTRRRPKRLALRSASGSDLNDDIEMMKQTQENEKIEVSITSKEILPKLMALARLLRAENIQNILKVKYKSPYKVLIEFGDRESANKLLTNKRFADSNYWCQLTQELQMTFGIVRNIDLDVHEEEMTESFESEYEILSIKRLKRYKENGDWTESESVRVCFKSSHLPSYVRIYGCRVKVEPFTFPVTQCSSCWRYGHSKKFCPGKKVLCPKCGNQHSNCETKLYTCINCNGDHMALDRMSCPVFHKEKEIRKIMCHENCKYRQALLIYYNKRKPSDRLNRDDINEDNDVTKNHDDIYNERDSNRTYRDVLVTEAEIHTEIKEMSTDSEKEEQNIETALPGPHKVKRKKKKGHKAERTTIHEGQPREHKEQERKRKRFDFARLLEKIKEICLSETSFENKIKLIFKIMIEEVKILVFELIRDSDILKNIFNIFYNV